ncbi:CDC27 family protein [Campylobacter lari]
MKYLNMPLNLDESQNRTHYYKAECLRSLGDFHDVLQCYEDCLKITKENIDSLVGKIQCLEELKEYEQALEYTKELLKLGKENEFALKNQNILMQKLKQQNKKWWQIWN